MIPLASLEQLSDRLGVALDPETPDGIRAQAALEDASALVRGEAGADYVDDHGELQTVPDVLVTITIAAAYRAFRNPDGKTQTSVGDVSISYSRQAGEAQLFLTLSERRAIRRAAGIGGLTSVSLSSGYFEGRDPHYVPTTQLEADWIPMGPYPWEP